MLEQTSEDGLEKLGSASMRSVPWPGLRGGSGAAGHPSSAKPEITSSSREGEMGIMKVNLPLANLPPRDPTGHDDDQRLGLVQP